MSDLISRSALHKKITDGEYTTGNIFKDVELLNFIKEQPTAYDVEQVVKELEGRKNRPPELEYRHLNFEEAIEIVKGGGVNVGMEI